MRRNALVFKWNILHSLKGNTGVKRQQCFYHLFAQIQRPHPDSKEFLPNTSIYLVQQRLLLQNTQFANTGGTHCKHTFAKKGSDPQWVRGMREEGEEDAFPSTALFTDAIHLANAIVTLPLQKNLLALPRFYSIPPYFYHHQVHAKKKENIIDIYIYRERE